MTAVALATACAVIFGTADFFGGLATRRSRVLAVVVISQVGGLLLVCALMPVLPGTASASALLWGMASGVAGAAGIVLFYQALASGMMSVVAPTTATTSMAVPVLFGLVRGERPPLTALAGIVLGLLAVLMVSRESGGAASGSRVGPIVSALASGAGFGGFFVLLKLAPAGSGLWPLAGARIASISLVVLLALASRKTLRPIPGALPVTIAAGVLDMAANILYLLAARGGMLSLVGVLVSLYPASTLLLARYVLDERLNRIQIAGVGFALGAVALIALPA
ncbi:DMT family transporter [Microtetraspora sp. NBRC 16547]|uniref:DMT family transporter n=1 Tax=Microtetraspora sp. NBRC 16547 TaxID=3030993 RepID=UPI0024A3D236|nr:DMT family transporter [Microtetraspora sp. NBRC 16547]GLX00215.1 multidrug transporter [Microtetraspora sp. NBRC 16547]